MKISNFPLCCGFKILSGFGFDLYRSTKPLQDTIYMRKLDDKIKGYVARYGYVNLIAIINEAQKDNGIGILLQKSGFKRTRQEFNSVSHPSEQLYIYTRCETLGSR